MKVVFAGPSLHRYRQPGTTSVEMRGPAFQGDIYAAVREGANVIGIVDGFFESVSSVWHKEILYALSRGVRVFGSSSMGALRAAECADFGMVGIGDVFRAYRDGELVDDDAVALVHAPAELDFAPLTVPLVNVIWTLEDWRKRALVDPDEASGLLEAARGIFFKNRTWRTVVEQSQVTRNRAMELIALAKTSSVDQKALDARELIARVEQEADCCSELPHWQFSQTDQFEKFIVGMGRNEHAL